MEGIRGGGLISRGRVLTMRSICQIHLVSTQNHFLRSAEWLPDIKHPDAHHVLFVHPEMAQTRSKGSCEEGADSRRIFRERFAYDWQVLRAMESEYTIITSGDETKVHRT